MGNIEKEKIAVGKQRKRIPIFFSENGVLKEKTKKLLELNNGTKKKEGFGTFAIGQDFEKDHFWSRKVREREKHYADFYKQIPNKILECRASETQNQRTPFHFFEGL